MQTLSLSRFDLLYAVGRVPHDRRMATIELYGREVIPRVRELLAAAAGNGPRKGRGQELTMAMAAIEIPDDLRRPTGPELDDLRLGIVGAGKLGTTLARAAVAAGYDVAISGSGPADDIALTVEVLAAGARAATTDEVVRHADIIVLAVPTHRFRELPRDLFAGKILIDAMNYWEPVDGDDPELTAARRRHQHDRARAASPPRAWSRASTNSATTNSKRTGAPREHPTASRSAQPATTASRSAKSCGSSIGSGSTPSTPGR